MNGRERFLTALNGGIPDRVPLFETHFGLRYIREVLGPDVSPYHNVDDEVAMSRATGLDMVWTAPLGFTSFANVQLHGSVLLRRDETSADKTGQDRTGTDRTVQDSTGLRSTAQHRTGPERTGQRRTAQDCAAQHSTGQDRNRQDSAGLRSTAQDRTDQDVKDQDGTGRGQ